MKANLLSSLSSVINSLFGIKPEEGMVITPEQARIGIVTRDLDLPLLDTILGVLSEEKLVQLIGSD